MGTSSIEVMKQANEAIKHDNLPKWLDSFLGKAFFDTCPADHGSRNKDLNRYCITCDILTCKDCVASGHHDQHQLLTIYKHVYQNAVPVDQMENHIDCKKIQHYRCNKKLVLSLTPLPHNGSGALLVGDGACHACKRKLTDHVRFHFCSIICQVQALARERSNIQPSTSSSLRRGDEIEKPINYRRRSRKGVPHRAPLF
ncbi:hypothetical protein CDL12_20804 [Handroanthus impetiginosus]|uniref:B box-type domain-containing protein n=1 Tax=Handroanthus impetiginosus TaxID=429701 RepID=A0A2G9GN48_9LAMI|nr:hypothetical protein CDL12_20804 [Handroanthus impetiginosus]